MFPVPLAIDGFCLFPADLGPRVKKRVPVHLNPVVLFGADEITASAAQYFHSFTEAMIFGDAGFVTAEYLAFADF
jgi:hypothetical protein